MASNGSVKKVAESTKSDQPLVSSESSPPAPVPNTLVTIYLQMTDWTEFCPEYLNYLDGIRVMCINTPDVAFYRFLYSSVGKQRRWHDRLSYSDGEIKALLLAPGTSIHVLYMDGAPAGYIELVQHKEGPSARFISTEIAYFGLREGYDGRGLGKHLLSHCIAYAWNNGTQRMWAHTCNLDGSDTLDNYLKRGFKVYKVDKEPMPDVYLYGNQQQRKTENDQFL